MKQKHKEKQQPKIVVIGGGTGSSIVLSGLKNYPLDLTAVVTVADDGGSTGRIRDEFGFLPVGDIRQCIAALSSEKTNGFLKELLLYRFTKGTGLLGHNLGNLILTALEDLSGSESKGLELAGKIFRLKGKIYPVSLQLVKLAADYTSGKKIVSEHKIEEYQLLEGERIKRLYTIPKASVNPCVEEAIVASDLTILGPGDLFDSTIANLIIGGVVQAIRRSRAKILYIVNLMTLKSQTNGFSAADHVKELENYLGKKVDDIIINSGKIPADIRAYYAKKQEYPVRDDMKEDPRVVRGNFVARKRFEKPSSDLLKRSLVRHDSLALARAIVHMVEKLAGRGA